MMDKYGVGQDPYCYPGSDVLRNLLNIHDEEQLHKAERELSEIAVSKFRLLPPPYDLSLLQHIHKSLFSDVYEWAGLLRTVNIQKGDTLFCTADRIAPEAEKIFRVMENAAWFEGASKAELIVKVAETYGDLNVIHPFREGNGRAQRILFEQIIINAGFAVDWWLIKDSAWIPANIDAVTCDYSGLQTIFERCIGDQLNMPPLLN
ncbi:MULTISPECIES: putative adenosine monophosphate-protein transferase Fic [unclassified Pseudomonas]|jgi:cell filamentation protein|uniref:putative adenosine monophosphate-protein transferase Fic n=1 Tax=unclassified Pseudomonas TaxID=196821 RepID=UPI00070260FE|nr:MULTISPECIES: putative adenosine monophosphate-protein transferase Fic [unclassified Pseudomonas]KQZ94508.1 cell filamentation protein Fic [Pseudomonas sp. Root562]